MLEKHIKSIINEIGYITLEYYMSLVIPYYYEHHVAIGREGDFITAPEVSSLFGKCIAAWISEATSMLPTFSILELGGGNGTLARDILGSIDRNKLYQYNIYDSSNRMKAKQMAMLKEDQIVWPNSLSEVENLHPIIVIGNEFFDAFPIKQFTKHDGVWYETIIMLDENQKLAFGRKRVQLAAKGDIIELSPQTHLFIDELCRVLNPHALLFIDYGYNEDLNYSSIQALKAHAKVHPLDHIGDSDLTAHVDYRALSASVVKHGFKAKISTQKQFLEDSKIDMSATPRLTHLEEMGCFLVLSCIAKSI